MRGQKNGLSSQASRQKSPNEPETQNFVQPSRHPSKTTNEPRLNRRFFDVSPITETPKKSPKKKNPDKTRTKSGQIEAALKRHFGPGFKCSR